jgi:hypothetical protein
VLLAHATPLSTLSAASVAFGLGTIENVVPFHFSIRVDSAELVSVLANQPPTAKHPSPFAHRNPESTLTGEAGAFALGTIDHFVPSQCTAKVFVVSDVLYCPTAVQFAALMHCTAASWLVSAPAGTGLTKAAHLRPFQPWIIRFAEVGVSCVPTAKQKVAVGHETDDKWP